MDKDVILLVEDNPDDVALALRALKKHNLAKHVVVARDGVEALDFLFVGKGNAARLDSKMPRLVILDLKLPRLDGLEVLRRLRADERTKLVPVVILTTSNEKRDIVRCYESGANSYIRKPVNFSEFNEVMRQLGSYWLSLNQSLPQGLAW